MRIWCLIVLQFLACFESAGQASAVANLRQNIVYIGIPNPLNIVAAGYPCESVFVSVDRGRIEKGEGQCRYMYTPDDYFKVDVSIKVLHNKDTLIIGTHEFRVKDLPPPVATVGGRRGGNIKKEVMVTHAGIKAMMDMDLDCSMCKVQSFQLLIATPRKSRMYASTNDLFTQEMYKALGRLKTGDILFFSEIKSLDRHGRVVELNSIFLTIE